MPERKPLSDAAVVLRAGTMRSGDLRRNALTTLMSSGYGRLGISVRAADGEGDETLMREPFVLGHAQMRRSTAERIRSKGFEVEPTGDPYHATIWLPDVEDRTLEALTSAFDAPEANPASESLRE